MSGPLRLYTPSHPVAENLCTLASRYFGDNVCYDITIENGVPRYLYFIIFPEDLGGIVAGHQARDWLEEQGCESVSISSVPPDKY